MYIQKYIWCVKICYLIYNTICVVNYKAYIDSVFINKDKQNIYTHMYSICIVNDKYI